MSVAPGRYCTLEGAAPPRWRNGLNVALPASSAQPPPDSRQLRVKCIDAASIAAAAKSAPGRSAAAPEMPAGRRRACSQPSSATPGAAAAPACRAATSSAMIFQPLHVHPQQQRRHQRGEHNQRQEGRSPPSGPAPSPAPPAGSGTSSSISFCSGLQIPPRSRREETAAPAPARPAAPPLDDAHGAIRSAATAAARRLTETG